jgi:GTP diphosphokinase / guanosine-3',5'-bis(diphosphate) 3'-diphosphatase
MRLNDILDAVSGYATDADLDLVMRAYVYSARAHAGQMRRSGEPYLIHPIAVAGALAELKMDVDTIAVGLLHDTMEDCLCTHAELEEEFGLEVADMVDGVTKIGKLEFRTKEEAEAENFRKLVLAMAKDVRVIMVKLCDRLHNMRTLEHMKPEKQRAIAQETIDIYAPIANRLGLSKVKTELEDICFRYLHPEVFETLTRKVGEGDDARNSYIARASESLLDKLKTNGLDASVTGRPKHVTSIYRKMVDQNLAFEQIHDLLAFRVFVDDLGQCYTALGLIHATWRHVPERLKDYIANPKSNGYQSLHTVVFGPSGRQIEIQIRTHEMHHISEVGIAAHWRYKEGHLALSKEDLGKIARLRELFEAAREVDDPAEFLQTVKVDLFADELYAFTPKGDVKFFPEGATVLDFAYAIHTEVGNTTTGAKVNGRMVPLRHELQAGDTVEIVRRPDQRPSRAWLDIARTGRALSKIRRVIHEEERAKGRETGEQMLGNELRKRGYNLAKLVRQGRIREAAQRHGQRDEAGLYAALGMGNLTVRKALVELVKPEELDLDTEKEEGTLVGLIRKLRRRNESPVLISGEADVVVSYAQCCNPLPGEAVEGFITRGRGISVHVRDCTQLLASDPARRIPVQWSREAKGVHTGEIRIVCANVPGMLMEIGAACKTSSIDVTRMEARSIADDKALFTLEVNVSDVAQLKALMRAIEKINDVISVDRIRQAAAG